MSAIDFETLFSTGPNAYVLLDLSFNIVTMNDAYLRATMRTRADLTGRNIFDAFPSEPQSESHRQLRVSLERTIATGQVDHIPLIHYNIALPDGEGLEERYWSATHTPIFDADGKQAFILQHTVDVTDVQRLRILARNAGVSMPLTARVETDILRRAEEIQAHNNKLEKEHRSLRSLFAQAPGFMAVLSFPDYVFTMANDAYRRLVGDRDVTGQPLRQALPEIVEQGFIELLDQVCADRQPFIGSNVRVLLQHSRSGAMEERILDFIYQPIFGEQAEVIGVFVQGQDVTEQKKAEDALRESEQRFRYVAETAPVMLWMADTSGNCSYLNQAQREFWGVQSQDVETFAWSESIHPDDRQKVFEATQRGTETEHAFCIEARLQRADGRFRTIRTDARPRRGPGGMFLGMIGVNVDITDLKVEQERRQALLALSDRFRDAVEPADFAFATGEILGKVLDLSRAGYGTIDPVAETITLERGWHAPGERDLSGIINLRDYGTFIDDLKRGEMVVFSDGSKDHRTAAKADRLKEIGAQAIVNMPIMEKGSLVAMLYLNSATTREWTAEELAFVRDVAERTRTAVERRRAEQDLQALASALETKVEMRTAERDRVWRNSRDLLAIADTDGVVRSANPAWKTVLGLEPEQAIGRNYLEFVWEDDVRQTRRALAQARWSLNNFENRLCHVDGTPRWISWHTSVEGDFVFAYGRHITAEKEQAKALREAEEQLRQAQKMEALGQLTGGVAHDFNNLLQVISGNLQLLGKDVAGNERAGRRIEHALAGVDRGAKLASQLLAFSRRQALEPKVLNIGRLVTGMGDMLRRTIGEATDIETIVAPDLWNTLVDPAQIENAILNLALNSRDAMDGHGTLTIEVSNTVLDEAYARSHADAVPGDYVLLVVSDTGRGMSPEIAAQVFEPFFSTKPLGKGTGLGLSMVYGFVRQSGGHLQLLSEIGKGTTIRIYLPRSSEAEDTKRDITTDVLAGGSETILVAEDDEAVRATVVEMLSDLGYTILTARDAASALTVIESGVAIDLLFTDVVMPGPLKSTQLAERARQLLPGIAILFTSGYTENSIVHDGRLDAGVELLPKPYSREALARKIRYVIARQAETNRAQATVKAETPQPLTILLVEDDALIRMDTADILAELGHTVIEAGSAEQAIKMMEEQAVDLLFTDIGLPGLSGSELAIRTRESRPDIAVVFASGNDQVPPLAGSGASFFLRKPYSISAVASALRTIFPNRPDAH
ncbi:histidine kinase [Metarhizobium album]|uniref:histidine kinase n=1 Tax=Metarhizobium album TaxID=2182425 RepID=A0A2U2DLT8_9HYPH|nr:histidine kinase [Rhizobium album]